MRNTLLADMDREVQTSYQSLDGLLVSPAPFMQEYIQQLQARGYTRMAQVRGTFGWTELAMHMRIMNLQGVVAFVNERGSYAYVLAENGRVYDGCWHQFADGSFTIS